MPEPKVAKKVVQEEASFEELIDDFSAPSDPVEVLMPSGKIHLFQIPVDVTAQKAFDKAKREFITKMQTAKDLPPAMAAAVKGQSEEALGLAFTVHYMALKPKCEQLTALKLLRSPYVLEYLEKQLEAHRMMKSSALITEVVQKQKKELSETTSGDSS